MFLQHGSLGDNEEVERVCVKEASEAEVLGHIMAFNNEILPVVWQACKAVLLTKPKAWVILNLRCDLFYNTLQYLFILRTLR